MGTASEIGTAGIPPAASKFIHGTGSITQTSAGSSQSDAQAITNPHVLLTSVAASSGVILPATATEGDWFTISNQGGQDLAVYPPTSGVINNGSANAAVTVANGTQALIVKLNGVHWTAVLGA